MPVFEQSIQIKASATAVDRCITELELMQRWLNPILKCEPKGVWQTSVGSKSKFVIQIPVIKPTLNNVVIVREPGLIIWGFDGFFKGSDRWECQPNQRGTRLLNQFEFQIPNRQIAWGFNLFAAKWTKADMAAQLRRIKIVAEELHQSFDG
ncbi:SRPBCC family protein [Chamaesiphon sp.]|uniref:SRPBCC family protein n=1 Tax=Chamaesiphon sp. TaxID=2814140 RepID=UPI00359358CB